MIRHSKSPFLEGRGKGRDCLAPHGFVLERAGKRWESLPRPLPSREGGFTLMEIVLAIGLTSVVMYLLMTAVELYMIRVDSSRGRVESAQLARTILDQMAADVAAMRVDAAAPAARGGNQTGQSPSGGQSQGTDGMNSSTGVGSANSRASATATTLHGIFGAAEQLRIDRAAAPSWERASRDVDPTEPTGAAELPRTVRYYVSDGTALSAQQLAQRGVDVETQAASAAGLYREIVPTAALNDDADPLASPTTRDGATLELLAPEVVKLELHYFDGEQLLDEWDVVQDGGLPAGVEILLTVHEPDYGPNNAAAAEQRSDGPRYAAKDLVVYRRFVRIPKASPPQPAAMLLPAAQQEGGGPGGAGGGQGFFGGGQGAGGGAGTGGPGGGPQEGGGNGN